MIGRSLTILTIAAVGLGAWSTAALAKSKHRHDRAAIHHSAMSARASAAPVTPQPSYTQIVGNNPNTPKVAAPPVANPRPYVQFQGNNPLINKTAAPAVANAQPYHPVPGNNPMR
jgi:hypothetical protein